METHNNKTPSEMTALEYAEEDIKECGHISSPQVKKALVFDSSQETLQVRSKKKIGQ